MATGFSFQEGLPYYRVTFDAATQKQWQGGLVQDNDFPISPAAAVLSYGQSIFEGTKVFRGKDGQIRFFRPAENARRLQRSAEIVGLPPVPEKIFFEGLETVVSKNLGIIPPFGEGSLYVRPLEFGSNPLLGQKPATTATFLVWVSPVGEFFSKEGNGKGLRLKFVNCPRVAANGIGEAKVSANYVGSLVTRNRWVKEGFNDIVFGRSDNLDFLTEATGANAFVYLKDNTIVTPPLDGEILAGITRASVIDLLKAEYDFRVIERKISFDEIKTQAREMFFTGTAWTVASVEVLEGETETVSFSSLALGKDLGNRLSNIQFGIENDPFGWTSVLKI